MTSYLREFGRRFLSQLTLVISLLLLDSIIELTPFNPIDNVDSARADGNHPEGARSTQPV